MTFISAALAGLLALREPDSTPGGGCSRCRSVVAHATNNLMNDYVDSRGVDRDNYYRARYDDA